MEGELLTFVLMNTFFILFGIAGRLFSTRKMLRSYYYHGLYGSLRRRLWSFESFRRTYYNTAVLMVIVGVFGLLAPPLLAKKMGVPFREYPKYYCSQHDCKDGQASEDKNLGGDHPRSSVGKQTTDHKSSKKFPASVLFAFLNIVSLGWIVIVFLKEGGVPGLTNENSTNNQ